MSTRRTSKSKRIKADKERKEENTYSDQGDITEATKLPRSLCPCMGHVYIWVVMSLTLMQGIGSLKRSPMMNSLKGRFN